MPNAYDDPSVADAFNQFLDSENGRIQKQLLLDSLLPYLTQTNADILDAACGQGWLSAALREKFSHVEAFDSSASLIDEAKRLHPGINFRIADATQSLPYAPESFDYVILNMAAHDLYDLKAGFTNLYRLIKPGGTFLMTVANPYYSFPVGIWKRGIIGRLLRRKPSLKVRAYHNFHRQGRKLFHWKGELSSYFHPLSEYLNNAMAVGFNLLSFQDLGLAEDSSTFNSQYQLHRFPMILLLVFEKRGK